MFDPRLHSRQFVLGPRSVKPKDDWQSIELAVGLVLSHCPKLRIAKVADRRGRAWLLLGLAVQADPAGPSPEEDLRSYSGEDVSTVYNSWAGRWLLIGEGTIHLDAGGLLGCYYRLVSDASGRQHLWASSSLGLLATLPGVERPAGTPRQLRYGYGKWLMEFDPPPRTGHVGIRKLLPTQTLDTASGMTRLRPLALGATRALSYDQLLDRLASGLVTAMKNIDGKVWLALSAGYDSRLLLAAAKVAGAPFRTYTQTFPTMTVADRTAPAVLSNLVGVEHVLVHPTAEDPKLLEVFDAHCGGQYVDADRSFFARGQWSWTKPGDVAVRGLAFEIGSCFYYDRFPPDLPPVELVLQGFGAVQSERYVQESTVEYVDWVSKTPIEGMDWRDRLYLDMRLGGWAGSAEQALDIVEGNRFFPANALRHFELILAVPEQKRRKRQYQLDLIERLAPELLEYPFNAPDGFFRVTRARLRKYRMFMREYGFASTLQQVNAAIAARRKRGQGRH